MISIIILNYNTAAFTKECLNSIIKFRGEANTEIIVVDNNSSERSIENLENEFDSVQFYFRDKNDGFAGGCNFGAKKANGDYLLFLNPDVVLIDNSVFKLKNYLENNTECGITSGVMMNEKNEAIYFYNNFPSFKWELNQFSNNGYKKMISELLNKKEIAEEKVFEVDWFHGAFLMMTKINFNALNGFDERYFMYYEDSDICYRMKKILNKTIVCLPEVKVFHRTQSSISNESNDNIFVFHIHRGKIIFLRNYTLFNRSLLHLTGMMYVVSRILILPFWKKYKNNKKDKYIQLLKVLKLYISRSYVNSSKYEYIRT